MKLCRPASTSQFVPVNFTAVAYSLGPTMFDELVSGFEGSVALNWAQATTPSASPATTTCPSLRTSIA
ncbi:MAG: hypothetical protein ACE15D_10260 [Candidatus Eisenbacteria bacterium]